ncbi:MAG: hypothetical protein M1830_007264 [Pleopsidium flavum]|nr:MAG: hypothetical protein M1830_007264 [Pleopsidium flavum]
MTCSRHGSRAFQELCKASPKFHTNAQVWQQCRRLSYESSRPHDSSSQSRGGRSLAAIVAIGIGTSFLYGSQQVGFREAHAEAPAAPLEIKTEKPKKRKGVSKEDNRDLISSQHLQVKKSWENPGVYAWGSNSGRTAAPDSEETYVKTPRRIPFFDGVLLRDIKLDRNFGAAVTENGDLLQWGTSYSKDNPQPAMTLKGKNLVSISISRDRVVGLAKNGKVYSLPVSQADQASGPKLQESTWIPFWTSPASVSYRILQPKDLSWGERVSAISGGLEHLLLLTSTGRLFSAASGSQDFPSRGQMGVPGLTWTTRPEGPYDMCHEISTLRGFEISRIAAGDYHSLALDKEGRVFAFGDNSVGQLGFDYNPESPNIDAPSLLPIQKLYSGTNQQPKVISVAAGGVNSFFTIDAMRVAGQGEDSSSSRGLGRVTADTWSCGQGIWGGLGNGRWTHVQGTPIKVKALSGLFEWDEKANRAVPIRLAHLSVGSTHAAAIMNNVTHVGATEKSSENDTNWGADVLWWGGNEFYQLGTRKRNNVSNPTYIAPMDVMADKEKGRREQHRFQITPRHSVKINGRTVSIEQRIECGRNITAVYSGV